MERLGRREVMLGMAGAAIMPAAAWGQARAEVWTFDRLDRIGGHRVTVEGAPCIVRTQIGPATQFDGVKDALFIDNHPLAGAERFTFEALFRPDGGAFEQRWFHLESDGATARMLFEIRVKDGEWYLDTFVLGAGYRQPLIDPAKRFPLGHWYHVAQSYDGATYRAYVNGVLQAEAAVAFRAQGPGRVSVGIRINRVHPFKGAVRQAAFVKGEACAPGNFVLRLPRRQVPG